MKTINEYNKRLAVLDHRIFSFNTETNTSYCLAEMNPEAGFFEKLMKTNIKHEVIISQDFRKVAKEAEELIAQYGSGFVGAK